MRRFIEYLLTVTVLDKEGYNTVRLKDEIFSVNVPLEAAGSVDLNALANALVIRCEAELQQPEDEEA